MRACFFPGSRTIGAPKDWDQELDGTCGVVYVVDQVDMLSGQNFMYSVYQPTEADLKALNEGGAIRLGFMGRAHPVFNMVVLTKERCEEAEIEPRWEMGDPI